MEASKMDRREPRLAALTDPAAVRKAVEEYSQIGREAFLVKYGFGPARVYFLVHEGSRYDSKAIAAAAYGYQHPELGPLRSDQFSGGERSVKARLEALGFTVERISSGDLAIAELQAGDVLTNRQLMSTFKVSNSGGMRRSLETDTLVLVSDLTKSLYLDEWEGDILHYCGMGQKGDQTLTGYQNKTLAESRSNGVAVHLFEVYEKNRYTYIGRLELAGEPYHGTQDDVDKKPRRVWVFPLRLVSGQPPALPSQTVRQIEQRQRKQARRLSDAEVAKRAAKNSGKAGSRTSTTTVYVRDAFVAEHARRRAAGHCELCKQPAPFKDKDGEPFLEVHHVVWLARGGQDSIENTVALCPNCHRRMHVLNREEDRSALATHARANSTQV
jgi:5-methylcytosine-specific restriction protein A